MMDIFSQERPKEQQFKLGTVTALLNGNPVIQFDGETTVSQKIYKRLSSYSPAVNDRVLLCRVAGTYIILGKVI